MIDIDKIEAAAKAAEQYPFNTKRQSDHHWQTPPATVLEMVSMIRERDAALRLALEAIEEGSGHIGLVLQDAVEAIRKVLEP